MLLSHEGWLRLRGDMAAASFPVVEQLGQYRAEASPAPLWVYQVGGRVGGQGGGWGPALVAVSAKAAIVLELTSPLPHTAYR